jgi:hypothetical protein
MMRVSWWTRLGIAGLIAASVAWAAIPAADGTISGCYNTKNGKLRVVDGTACKKKETALSWNQAGQTGPQGEPGAPGAPGADTRIFAFVQTFSCCGGDGMLLDPPLLRSASGITAAERVGAGQYAVTVNRDVNDCIATATLASDDAAYPQAGLIGVGRPSGIPDDEFLIVTRDTNGTLADIGSTGGTYGISIAVFCPS